MWHWNLSLLFNNPHLPNSIQNLKVLKNQLLSRKHVIQAIYFLEQFEAKHKLVTFLLVFIFIFHPFLFFFNILDDLFIVITQSNNSHLSLVGFFTHIIHIFMLKYNVGISYFQFLFYIFSLCKYWSVNHQIFFLFRKWLSKMIIIIENGVSNLSSNLRWGCLCFSLH